MKVVGIIPKIVIFAALATSAAAQITAPDRAPYSAKGFEVLSARFLLNNDKQPTQALELAVLATKEASRKKMRKYAQEADRYYMNPNVAVIVVFFFHDRDSHRQFLQDRTSYHGQYIRGRKDWKFSFDYFPDGYKNLPLIPIRLI